MPTEIALAEAAPATWNGLNVVVLSPTPSYPLDAGNRRRVFHLTQSLRDLGARIVFVHYPSEGEWRKGVPAAAVAAMSAQWDGSSPSQSPCGSTRGRAARTTSRMNGGTRRSQTC